MIIFILLLLAGLCGGFINGLLGTGGGIVIIFALNYFNKKASTKDNFATVIAAILPMSIVSAFMYYKDGNINIERFYIYILPAIAGGLLGAFLLEKIKLSWLRKIFAAIVIYAGITMIK